MGVVYYGNYAQYLEQGRTEWLRSLGFSYKYMEENQVMLPVVNLTIDYKYPAKYDDVIKITTTLKKTLEFFILKMTMKQKKEYIQKTLQILKI